MRIAIVAATNGVLHFACVLVFGHSHSGSKYRQDYAILMPKCWFLLYLLPKYTKAHYHYLIFRRATFLTALQ